MIDHHQSRPVGVVKIFYIPLGYRQILQADASVVDLNKLGPYYFDLGRKLCDLEVMREKDEIQRALIEAYGTRFRTIMDASQNIMRVSW